jgi:hypothetical protein
VDQFRLQTGCFAMEQPFVVVMGSDLPVPQCWDSQRLVVAEEVAAVGVVVHCVVVATAVVAVVAVAMAAAAAAAAAAAVAAAVAVAVAAIAADAALRAVSAVSIAIGDIPVSRKSRGIYRQ